MKDLIVRRTETYKYIIIYDISYISIQNSGSAFVKVYQIQIIVQIKFSLDKVSHWLIYRCRSKFHAVIIFFLLVCRPKITYCDNVS